MLYSQSFFYTFFCEAEVLRNTFKVEPTFLKVYWQSLSSFRAEPKFFKVAKMLFIKSYFWYFFCEAEVLSNFCSCLSYRLRILHGSLYRPSEKMCINAKKNLHRNPRKKNFMYHEIRYNSAIFWATDLGFCMEFYIDHPKKIDIHATKNSTRAIRI